MTVDTKCVSQTHEALSSIFHPKCWGVADCSPAHSAHTCLAGAQAGLTLPRPPPLGSLGVISLGRQGMQQPFLEKPFHFAQVSVRALALPTGQRTAEPLAVPGADMAPGGSGAGRRRLAKMLQKLYHRWR